jgi:PAS domain S-box-containing protein
MTFEFPLYSLAFVAGGVLALVVAVVTLTRRSVPGALPFSIMLLALAGWTFARALTAFSIDFDDKIFWYKIMFFGAFTVGVLWLSFILDYTGSTWWRRPANLVLLYFIPVMSFILIWTNQWHGWVWTNISMASNSSGEYLVWNYGFWFWVGGAYQYLVIAIAVFVLWRYLHSKPGINRNQTVALIIGTVIPILGYGIYLVGWDPFFNPDVNPIFFNFGALAYAVAIFYFRFLDIVPEARGRLLENMPVAILVLDPNGLVADINPATEQITGLKKWQILGKRLSKVWPRLDSVRADLHDGQHTELVVGESAFKKHLNIGMTELRDKRGEVTGQLLLLRDITERKMTQKKLESLFDEEHLLRNSLQMEIEKRNKYSRAIVHELNTPLTAILSSSQLLEEGLSDAAFKPVVGNIRRASLNLEQRINDLIELSSGEVGQLKIYPLPLDVSQLLQETIDETGQAASDKGLSLISEIPDELPRVMGDHSRLKQVLINLLSNAFKFTAEGKVTVSVSYHNLEYLLIQVEDTGRGIEKAQIEHLFDPYQRKSNEGQQLGGLGIGLALCKIFVELHKGNIWVESTQGKGSKFSFTVPIAKELPPLPDQNGKVASLR